MFVQHSEVEYNCSVSVKMLSILGIGLSLRGKTGVSVSFFTKLFVCLFVLVSFLQVFHNWKELFTLSKAFLLFLICHGHYVTCKTYSQL